MEIMFADYIKKWDSMTDEQKKTIVLLIYNFALVLEDKVMECIGIREWAAWLPKQTDKVIFGVTRAETK